MGKIYVRISNRVFARTKVTRYNNKKWITRAIKLYFPRRRIEEKELAKEKNLILKLIMKVAVYEDPSNQVPVYEDPGYQVAVYEDPGNQVPV